MKKQNEMKLLNEKRNYNYLQKYKWTQIERMKREEIAGEKGKFNIRSII